MIIVVDNTVQDESVMAVYLPKLLAHLKSKKQDYVCVKTVHDFQQVQHKATGVILSGSPLMIKDLQRKQYSEVLMLNMLSVMVANMRRIPVYGICFGCQFIHHMFGGKLEKLPTLVCKNIIVQTPRTPLNAQFCCTYVLQEPIHAFHVLGYAVIHDKKVPCMIQHKSLPLFGTLFHAENNKETHYILDKFLHRCMSTKKNLTKK